MKSLLCCCLGFDFLAESSACNCHLMTFLSLDLCCINYTDGRYRCHNCGGKLNNRVSIARKRQDNWQMKSDQLCHWLMYCCYTLWEKCQWWGRTGCCPGKVIVDHNSFGSRIEPKIRVEIYLKQRREREVGLIEDEWAICGLCLRWWAWECHWFIIGIAATCIFWVWAFIRCHQVVYYSFLASSSHS